MKRSILCLILCCFPLLSTAEVVAVREDFSSLGNWTAVSGSWKIDHKNRLSQTDTNNSITHIYTRVEQSGNLLYEFEVGYLDGLDDEYGGFGCHILIDKPTQTRSWGQNKSFLLWFTYDRHAYAKKQFYFQIYKSTGPRSMTIMHDARKYPIPVEYFNPGAFKADKTFSKPVKIKFAIDTATGAGKLYTPSDPDTYFIEFDIKSALPAGHYFSLRTNNLAAAFDNLTITRDPRLDPVRDVLLDASLSALEVSAGRLNPFLTEDVTFYTLDVDYAVDSINLRPAATGMIQVNGQIVLSNTESDSIDIMTGENIVTILVTAADALTVKDYTLAINRSLTPNEDVVQVAEK